MIILAAVNLALGAVNLYLGLHGDTIEPMQIAIAYFCFGVALIITNDSRS